jgi:hypothetical protein
MTRIIYYYQTFCGLDKILVRNTPVTHIHLSSLHFGLDENYQQYIHLNDSSPYDSKFVDVWKDIEKADTFGIKNLLMVGGAGGGYVSLFSNYVVYYNLLYGLIKSKPFIKGVDLDIEETVDINNVKKLINDLVKDFGEDFIISMAPIESSLQEDNSGMGGFCYKTLLNSKEGKYIKYFNTQFYSDYSLNAYDKVITNGYDPKMIVMGTINPDVFDTVLDVHKKYGEKFGGVYLWEYTFAKPDGYSWAKQIQDIINPGLFIIFLRYLYLFGR